MTYFGEKRLGNFKPTVTERKKAKRNHDPRADREGDDEDHRRAVKKLPCCIPGCNVVGCDPHHLKQTGTNERGGALRSPDKWAVPMCRHHHDEVERIGSKNELKWFEERGLKILDLAAALWNARPDAGAMVKIVFAHKGVR